MKPTFLMMMVCSFCFVAFGQQAPPNCHPEKSHQFDFWIGHWEVTANGQIAGQNRIEPILNGCALQENWVGAQGSMGTSLNFYNPTEDQWEQFWIYRQGIPMHFKGHFVDGKMVLKAERDGQQGKEIHRIVWTPNKDGSVRQVWEKRATNNDQWQTLFDGHYRKIESN